METARLVLLEVQYERVCTLQQVQAALVTQRQLAQDPQVLQDLLLWFSSWWILIGLVCLALGSALFHCPGIGLKFQALVEDRRKELKGFLDLAQCHLVPAIHNRVFLHSGRFPTAKQSAEGPGSCHADGSEPTVVWLQWCQAHQMDTGD